MTEMELINERLTRLEKKLLTGIDEPPFASPAETIVDVVRNESNRIRRNATTLREEIEALADKYDFITVARISLYDFLLTVREEDYRIKYVPRYGYVATSVAGAWKMTAPNRPRLLQDLGARIAETLIDVERESGELENPEEGDGDGKRDEHPLV